MDHYVQHRASTPLTKRQAFTRHVPVRVNALTPASQLTSSLLRALEVCGGNRHRHLCCLSRIMARQHRWNLSLDVEQEQGRAPDTVPPATRSESRLRPPATAPISVATDVRAVAERFRSGDFHGALLDATVVLDGRPVAFLCASPTYLARVRLRGRERWLLALVNGETELEDLLEASGLGLLEGIDAICGLLDAGIVAFDANDVTDPETLPGA